MAAGERSAVLSLSGSGSSMDVLWAKVENTQSRRSYFGVPTCFTLTVLFKSLFRERIEHFTRKESPLR